MGLIMIKLEEIILVLKNYNLNRKNIYTYLLLIIILSLIISLIMTLFNFNLRFFITFFLKTLIILYSIFSIIIYFKYRISSDEFDELAYKSIIIDTIFICLLYLIGKYNLR